MNNETKIKKAFDLFLGTDKLRPVFDNPFEINGFVYATNGHALIRAKKENIDFTFENKNKLPNVEGIIPKINESLIMGLKSETFEILKTEDEYKEVGQDIECLTCNGHGKVEWEFEHYAKDYDCPECHGSGYSEEKRKVKTVGKTFDSLNVKLKDSYFDINVFYLLIQAREILGGEIELISYENQSKASMFKTGICEVLLMPIYRQTDCDVKVLNLEIE